MKKFVLLLLTLSIVSLFSVSARAQSIVGTWTSNAQELLNDDAPGVQKLTLELVFKADRTAVMGFDVDMHMDEQGLNVEMGFKASMSGKYARGGKTLLLDLKKEATAFDIYKLNLKMTPEMEQALATKGITKKQVEDVLKQSVNAEEFFDKFDALNNELNIVTLTSTTLVLGDENGQCLTFQRKQ